MSRSVDSNTGNSLLAADGPRDMSLLDDLPLPVFIYDMETLRYLAVNQAAIETYGYSRDEFLAMTVTDIRPAEDVPRLLRTFDLLDRRPRKLGIWQHRRKDGSMMDVDIVSQDATEHGRRARLVIATDVTERLRSERAVRESEEKLARAQHLARIGSWELNLDTGETRWSAEIYRMLGQPPAMVPSFDAWAPLLHPEDREHALILMNSAVLNRPIDLEVRFLLPAGELVAHSRGELVLRDEQRWLLGTLQDVTDRRRLERAVRESEKQLSAAFQLIPDALNIGRLEDGVNIAVNEGFCRLTGYSHAEVVDQPSSALNIWVDPELRRRLFQQLSSTGVVREAEVRFRTKGGSEFIGLLSSQIFEVAGRKHFVTVTRDITEQKRAERAQAAVYRVAEAVSSSQSLQDLLRSIHETVAELMPAPNFYIALFDEASQRLEFPYYVDEHDDPPTGPVELNKGLTEYVLRTGQPLLITERGQTDALVASGEVHLIGEPSLSWLGVPLRTQQRTVGVLAAQIYSGPARHEERHKDLLQFVSSQVARAIERKQNEDALRASEQRFRALIENTSDGICLLAADGRIRYSSPGAEAMLGYEAGELGGGLFDHVHPEDAAQVAAKLQEVAERPGVGVLTQARAYRKDGSSALIEGLATNRLEDPSVRGIVLNIRDLTERKQMEARLMMADRMVSVGTLAAGVAHEINNPLAYVMANLSYASDTLTKLGCGQGSDVLEALRDAQEGSERVRKIVRDLKTFSRADEADEGPVDLHGVLEASINMAWNEVRHRARLVKDYAPALPMIAGNASRLGQVFLNLIINAAQAIAEGAAESNEIRITTRVVGDRVVVDVRDTGSGISREHAPRLFDPFFTTKPVGVGTGLGLFICQNIVNAQGGLITLDSTPGQGTVFHVALRIAQGAPVQPSPPPVSQAPRRARILIIDDEPMMGGALRRQLPDHDVTVETAAPAALTRLRAGERFDLILCDVMMPEVTGVAFHEQLSRELPDLAGQVVFMTGGAFTAPAHAFLDQVTNHRMDKPLDLPRVRALLHERLAR